MFLGAGDAHARRVILALWPIERQAAAYSLARLRLRNPIGVRSSPPLTGVT
jgi:hypothetical protein